MKILKRFVLFFVILFVLAVITMLILSSDPIDGCMDVGYCKEGLSLIIGDKKIIVTKQACIENYGIWYEDKKVCLFK